MEEPTNLKAALRLADAGFFLFPCHGGGEEAKAPLLKGVSWQKAATRHAETIKRWCMQNPTCVFGVDLGKSKLIVIDCDVKAQDEQTGLDGREAFDKLFDEQSPQGRHLVPVVGTPSGGTHYYFKQRKGEERKNGTGALPPFIDVRGSGGYVIAPYMRMEDGKEYEYSGDLNALINAQSLPDWLAQVLDEKRHEVKPILAPVKMPVKMDDDHLTKYTWDIILKELAILEAAPQTARNNTLNKVSFNIATMVGAGWISQAQVEPLIVDAARKIGLGEKEIKKTFHSGFSEGKKNPRNIPEKILRAQQEREENEKISHVICLAEEKKRRERDGVRVVVQTPTGEDYYEDTGELVKVWLPAPASPPVELDYPAGLVGDIAKWIVASARYPQPELSIGAALSIVGTVAGRQFAGPTFSGTHLYILGLAPTGKGKDRPLKSIDQILRAASLEALIAPPDFASIQAIEMRLVEYPLSISPMDEFGDILRRVNSKRGSTHENAIPKILRGLWSASFDPFTTTQGARRESHTIMWPAFGINGASTIRQFYSALEGSLLENGTLNRFLIVNGRSKVEECEPDQGQLKVPERIIEDLKRIFNRLGETLALTRIRGNASFNKDEHIVKLDWCPDGAQELYKSFSREISDLMEVNPAAENYYGRAVEMALRIATIIAIGRLEDESLRKSDMEYAIAMVRQSCQFMEEGAADYMAENEHQANAQKIKRLLKAAGGRMQHSELLRKLDGSIRTYDLKGMIQNLCESGILERQEVKTGGRTAFYYQLKS